MALESSAKEKETGSAFDDQSNETKPDTGSTSGSGSSGGDSGSGSSENETPTIDVSDPAAPPAPEDGGVAADAPTGTDPDDTINVDPSESNAGINDPSIMDTLFNGTDANGNKVGSTTSKNGGDTIDEQEISGSAWVENDPEPTKPDIEVTEPTIDITDPPTEAPTDAPTEPEPTDPPTTAPTEAPTDAPTEPEETEPVTEPVPVDESDDPVIQTHAASIDHVAVSDRGNTKYDFFQTCMNVLAYKFHFPVKNLVLACGGEDLLNELEEGGYHVPVYGDELMDDYLHDAHEQSVFTNALKMVFGDDTATDADREIADTELRHQNEDVEDGSAVSGDLNGDGVTDDKDLAITQSEWGVAANSAAPMTAEDTGIQKDLKNSQWDKFDAHTYQDVKDSGNGLPDNAAAVSGAEYYEGDAGAANGGIKGNDGMVSTGADGNPDYDRAPNDSAIEDANVNVDTSHNSVDDLTRNGESSYSDSLAEFEALQSNASKSFLEKYVADDTDFASVTTEQVSAPASNKTWYDAENVKGDDYYAGKDLPSQLPESERKTIMDDRKAEKDWRTGADLPGYMPEEARQATLKSRNADQEQALAKQREAQAKSELDVEDVETSNEYSAGLGE